MEEGDFGGDFKKESRHLLAEIDFFLRSKEIGLFVGNNAGFAI